MKTDKVVVTIVTEKGVFTFVNPMVINVKDNYEQIVHIVSDKADGAVTAPPTKSEG